MAAVPYQVRFLQEFDGIVMCRNFCKSKQTLVLKRFDKFTKVAILCKL